jgi:Autotransporter beta-domain
MKLLNMRLACIFMSTMFGVSFGAIAQTCSDPNVSVTSGQTCSSGATLTSNPSTVQVLLGGEITNSAGATSVNVQPGANTSIVNGGVILGGAVSGAASNGGYGISGGYSSSNPSTISSVVNTGSIAGGVASGNGSTGGYGLSSWGGLGSVTNSGSITGGDASSTSSNSFGGYGIFTNGGVTTALINNSMSIAGGNASGGFNTFAGDGLNNNFQTITLLMNSGSITGGNAGGASSYNRAGSGVMNSNIIVTLTNTGSIVAGTASGASPAIGYGINNSGTITTLNNGQGAGNAHGALTYKGALPTNYNIIINSTNNFGQLAVTGGTGSAAFGIYTGSTVANNHLYSSVLSGVTSSQVSNTSGSYGGYSWTLGLESGSTTIWDLLFGSLGPSTADTQQSLVNTAAALQNTYILQNSVLANSFSYDCNVFGANDVCISAGGRNTQVSAANGLNNTSALLIAAYRPHPNYRVGAYADQNLSVNNAGSTVNLGNNTPLIGLFGAWNERLDGTGTEVKVSAAYGQKNTTITRSVVGTSEAGSGSSQLNSQGAQVTAKYGFAVLPEVVVSPYVGIRYTQNNMGGYTEGTSSSVSTPLTYSALKTNATTVLAGVGASYKVIPTITTFASAGVETDTNTANGSLSAAGVSGLTPVNFNPNPVKTRPTAMLGASYDIEKNQRIGITGIYRQEAYQAVQTTTVMATYTVGL